MNDHIWTASGTDITIRWKMNGYVPPSEIQEYKDKWKYFQELPLRLLNKDDHEKAKIVRSR